MKARRGTVTAMDGHRGVIDRKINFRLSYAPSALAVGDEVVYEFDARGRLDVYRPDEYDALAKATARHEDVCKRLALTLHGRED